MLSQNFQRWSPKLGWAVPVIESTHFRLAKGTQVIVLMGTIPIFFNGVQYNIPLNIWVVDTYPLTAPMCVLNPTPGLKNFAVNLTIDMIIKPKHNNVDAQGICYLPYLTNWSSNSSSLVPLLTAMSQAFSLDPPLRSKVSTIFGLIFFAASQQYTN